MKMPGRYGSESNGKYSFGFNGMRMDDEMYAQEGNSYTTMFRQYDPRIARWLSTDPVRHEHFSPYNAFDNNPIYFADPSGADSEGEPVIAPDGSEHSFEGKVDGFDGNRLLKVNHNDKTTYYSWNKNESKYIEDDDGSQKWMIWHAADAFTETFVKLDNAGDSWASFGYKALIWNYKQTFKMAVDQSNPTWGGLSAMYAFEFGGTKNEDDGYYEIEINGNDKITNQQLFNHKGVTTTTEMALRSLEDSEYRWTYNLKNMYDNIKGEGQFLELFLGSYTTSVTVITKDDIAYLSYKVVNESTTESLTRFKRENGIDVGMLEKRNRGVKWSIGGNFRQTFTWSKSIPISKIPEYLKKMEKNK